MSPSNALTMHPCRSLMLRNMVSPRITRVGVCITPRPTIWLLKRCEPRDLGALQRRAGHQASVCENESVDLSAGGAGVERAVCANFQHGYGGIAASRPSVSAAEAVERLLGHEQ